MHFLYLRGLCGETLLILLRFQIFTRHSDTISWTRADEPGVCVNWGTGRIRLRSTPQHQLSSGQRASERWLIANHCGSEHVLFLTVCAYARTRMPANAEDKRYRWVSSSIILYLMFETVSLTEPEICWFSRLAGQQTPGILCLQVHLKGWDFRCEPQCPAFLWVMGISGPRVPITSTLPPSCLPSPQHSFSSICSGGWN